MTKHSRIERIVEAFLESSYWDANRFGCSSDDWICDPSRMERCDRAAEFGGDGSTHAEVIDDMREGFRSWLHSRSGQFAEYPYRIESAAMLHFDRLEDWHKQNGSLYEEIG